MEAGISVLVFLEDKSIGKARETINSVIEQNTNLSLQMLVCDMTGVFCEEIYQYDNYDVEYYVVENDISRFDLEMNLRQRIKYAYYTMINDNEYWTDREYLQRAVDFLEKNEMYSIYGVNAFIESRNENIYQLSNPKNIAMYYWVDDVYLIRGIEDYCFNVELQDINTAWMVPPAFVCRRSLAEKDIENLSRQDECVKAVFVGKNGAYLLHIKEGMCVLKDEAVMHIWEEHPKPPLWKQYLNQAMETYALKYYFEEISPRYINILINISFLTGIRKLKQLGTPEEKVQFEQNEAVRFLMQYIEDKKDISPLWIRSYGEKNPDKVFFVMRLTKCGIGLFASLFLYAGAIEYAEKSGALPMIDLKNCFVMGLQEVEQCGKENAWEYYFQQPTQGYTLEEVYQSKNVVLCDTFDWNNPVWYDMFPTDSHTLHKWSSIIRRYFKLKPKIEEKCNELFKMKLQTRGRVLGVCVRNGYVANQDEKSGFSNFHPVQASLQEYISYINEYMDKWDCDYVYIMADDAYVMQEMCKEFGEKCIYLNRSRVKYYEDGKIIKNMRDRFPADRKLVDNNISYIYDTYLLSKCTSFLSGNCGGGRMAYYWNDGAYEHVKVIEKGRY